MLKIQNFTTRCKTVKLLLERHAMDYVQQLQQAYRHKNITLYLGAGTSIPNGLPSWDKLVLAMYFSVIGEQKMKGWRPLPNYLFAIAEWYLSQHNEPLEITVRKLQKYFPQDSEGQRKFLDTMYKTLYSGLLDESGLPAENLNRDSLRGGNPTLDAIAYLCEKSTSSRGIQSVVTYNYDDFLEISLEGTATESIYTSTIPSLQKLSIYHVHGFIPIRQQLPRSSVDQLVFTETQYNKVAGDPNHWSNKVQLSTMSNSIGVMIGLSLADRNMRRLLYAAKNEHTHTRNYALLKRDKLSITTDALESINDKAIDYMHNFQKSGANRDFSSSLMGANRAGVKRGMKKKSRAPMRKTAAPMESGEPRYRYEIRGIIEQVEKLDFEQQEFVMKELGVHPIWYDHHDEIPEILKQIAHFD
ncbi:SIR2 family protein [Candidatus Uabimicrobium sp. HlEnr_7]|uniref:SIR2 family protein n=1 Tax=Candidatus Uabimicrobium helgolandensis TaxID=3095367 RepID=UPI003556C5FB